MEPWLTPQRLVRAETPRKTSNPIRSGVVGEAASNWPVTYRYRGKIVLPGKAQLDAYHHTPNSDRARQIMQLAHSQDVEIIPLRIVVAGAGGHAREILDLLHSQKLGQPVMYDQSPLALEYAPFQCYARHSRTKEVQTEFNHQSFPFVLAVGSPAARAHLYRQLSAIGGTATSVVASTAVISQHRVELGEGLNVMHFGLISCDTIVGRGSLINARANLHHDVRVGEFCEICPGAMLLGGVRIGHRVRVGSGAIVLPEIRIGDDVTIGAGAVVTKHVTSGAVVKGVPAQ